MGRVGKGRQVQVYSRALLTLRAGLCVFHIRGVFSHHLMRYSFRKMPQRSKTLRGGGSLVVVLYPNGPVRDERREDAVISAVTHPYL